MGERRLVLFEAGNGGMRSVALVSLGANRSPKT